MCSAAMMIAQQAMITTGLPDVPPVLFMRESPLPARFQGRDENRLTSLGIC